MISPASLCDIKDRIHTNEEKINILNSINVVLKERHEIETNYNHLHIKLNQMQTDEHERKEKHDFNRKRYLSELESHGQDLCKEHAHILHQIEHITWHLEGCTRHRPCMGKMQDSCPSKKSAALSSCMSTTTAPMCNRPSAMANLKNTSERLIKSIVDLRKKIYIVQEKLENEMKRKKEMEKKLSELRKDISRQKKSLSVRRTTHTHTPMASSTAATSLTHCPSIGMSSQTGHSCSSLPPIKKSLLAK